MRPGPGDPWALSSLASPTDSPVLITSALSALLRLSGALADFFCPTATVLTWGFSGLPLRMVTQSYLGSLRPADEGACDM